jgi:hypothetical protein
VNKSALLHLRPFITAKFRHKHQTCFLVRLRAVSSSRPAISKAAPAFSVKPGRRPPRSGAKRALRKTPALPRSVQPGNPTAAGNNATPLYKFMRFKVESTFTKRRSCLLLIHPKPIMR